MAYSAEERSKAQDIFCAQIASGASIRKACRTEGCATWPIISAWLAEDREFSIRYARAREARADLRAENIDRIKRGTLSGKLDPNAARVAIEAEKWLAARENNRKYGDKLNIDQSVTISTPEQRRARIAHLIGKADAGLISIDGLRAGRTASASGAGGSLQGADEILSHVPGDGAASEGAVP